MERIEQIAKDIIIWNPEGKRVLMETLYLMFYHDAQEQFIYFSLAAKLEIVSNEVLEMLIDQLNMSDEDEMRLRIRLEKQ